MANDYLSGYLPPLRSVTPEDDWKGTEYIVNKMMGENPDILALLQQNKEAYNPADFLPAASPTATTPAATPTSGGIDWNKIIEQEFNTLSKESDLDDKRGKLMAQRLQKMKELFANYEGDDKAQKTQRLINTITSGANLVGYLVDTFNGKKNRSTQLKKEFRSR